MSFLWLYYSKSHLHTNKKIKNAEQWIAVLIFLVVVIIFNISSREYSTSSKGNNRIENYGNNKGPSQTKAMAGVRSILNGIILKTLTVMKE